MIYTAEEQILQLTLSALAAAVCSKEDKDLIQQKIQNFTST